MSYRALLVQTYIVSAALFGSVMVSAAANAQSGCCEGGSAYGANAWTNGNNWTEWGGAVPIFDPSAPWPADAESQAGLKDGAEPYWWTHGELEIGGRDFVNNPTVGGQIYGNVPPYSGLTGTGGYTHLDQNSLAKFYEYSIQAPGAFGGGHVVMGSSDGLYQLDLWANNIASNFAGFSDQAYTLEASKAGEHYLTVSWDSTPHIYSTSAQTPWLGVGSNNLTLPGGTAFTPLPTSGTSAGYINILPYLHPIDLGIQRDTISFGYRWTPTDLFGEGGGGGKDGGAFAQYDFNTFYSHMDRYGTQAAGFVGLYPTGFPYGATQVPAPIDDTTQNFGVNGERFGDTPWGKYTFKLGYSGSIYTDNISSYSVQNPFLPTATKPPCSATINSTTQGSANCGSGVESTPPSNQANSIAGTMTADLPYNTRYAGTVSYTDMTQNAPFIDMTNNTFAQNTGTGWPSSVPWNTVNYGLINANLAAARTGNFAALGGTPVSSLNGDIQEILSNNVLTTQITPELTSKLSYRFYDFDNGTPNILFPCWASYDSTGYTTPSTAHPCGGSENTISSLSVSYLKQDAGAELNWRPERDWNFNAAYGFERYDYTQADVNATNENSVKLSADWRPFSWFDARLSGYLADRQYENYNYDEYVAPIQFPCGTFNGTGSIGTCSATGLSSSSWMYSPAYRQFMYDNRDESKAQFQTNIVVLPGVTISPSVKYQDDYYGINPNYNLGINDNGSVSWGVDLTYVPHPDLSLALSYYEEFYNTKLYSTSSDTDTSTITPANLVITRDNELVNTVTAAMSYVVIPHTLTFDLRASVSDGIDRQACSLCTGTLGNPAGPSGAEPVFPADTTLFSHVEATLIYRFDPDLLADTGFKDMKLKLRYLWERNAVTNWQNDPLAPYTASVSTSGIWMDYDNPNYNVQAVQASLIVKW